MTNVEVLDARRDPSGGYKVDVSRGQRIGRVSSEWFSRPADERYLSLSELFASVKGRTERSRTRTVESAAVRVEASRDDAEGLALVLPGSAEPVAPTHWSFGQLAGLVGAPAAYLRQLPATLAGINLQYGLSSHRAEQIKTLETEERRVELRAITGPDYGRIYDHELVAAVQRIAGNGTGDTRWKVPGVLDWSTGVYNPRVDVTADTEEDEGMRPIPDRLLAELTAHRTVALRDALGNDPHVAFLAALHALVLRRFYAYSLDTCVEIDGKSVGFAHQAPGLADTASAKAVDRRHEAWAAALPKEPEGLWDKLVGFDADTRQHLFAHCVAMSVNATYDAYNRRPRALTHADRLASAVDLDMVGVGWNPTVDNFLGRVTKARILAAVREAKGDREAQLIDHLKKVEMAERAQGLLAGTGWLPEPLRTPGRELPSPVEGAAEPIVVTDAVDSEPVGEETAADGGEPAMGEDDDLADDEHVAEADAPYAYAAE